MSRTLTQIRNEVAKLVRDSEDILDQADYNSAINQAVRYYSRAKPRYIVETASGDGSAYEWELPDSYLEDFSSIVLVEYPAAEENERGLQRLDFKLDYDVVRTATGKYKLRLLRSTPSSGETVRYTYTTLHSLTDSGSTLPSENAEHAVIFSATSICCRQLAAHYAQSIDPTLSEDAVDYGTKSERYSSLADHFAEMSGLKDVMQSSLISSVAFSDYEFDPPPTWNPNGDFIVHTRRRR